MKKAIAAAVLCLTCAMPALAQSVRVYDKMTMGLPWASYWPAELDGDPATVEYLGYTFADGRILRQVLIVRDGLLCGGSWFDPIAILEETMRRHGLQDEFLLAGETVTPIQQINAQNLRWNIQLRFDLPACGHGVPWVTGW